MKRVHADHIHEGDGDYLEGKLPLPFGIHRESCMALLRMGEIFAWGYSEDMYCENRGEVPCARARASYIATDLEELTKLDASI